MRFLLYLVILLLLFGFAYFAGGKGGLRYTYSPEQLEASNNADILTFLAALLFLLMIASIVSWLAAWVIINLGKGSSQELIKIGVETNVTLSWAWGFLCGGAALVCFMIFVRWVLRIPASKWWQAIGMFLPHLLATVILLLLSWHKASKS
jgi:hypothetical protein